jgi:hypothetical protein
MDFAPVAAFFYKRPAHSARLLRSLAACELAGETDLHIFCDAAKARIDQPAVREVRELARGVTGFRSVRVVEREENWGLSRSVTSATAELCERFGRVIAVEDDLVVAPGFLRFLNHGLNRYETEARVMQISGFQFDLRATPADRSVFLPLISCWGWATWKRAWRAYDPQAGGFDEIAADADRRHRFNLDGAYDYASLLKRQQEGSVDSWGVRWYLSVFRQDGVVLYPPRSLVSNEGFDGSGTHKVAAADNVARAHHAWPDPAGFADPEGAAVSPGALREVQEILRAAAPPTGLLARIRRRIAR